MCVGLASGLMGGTSPKGLMRSALFGAAGSMMGGKKDRPKPTGMDG